MLTWSNWKTEPRSNRFHYASRFGHTLPVIFVQEGTHPTKAIFEETATKNVTILHAPPSESAHGCDRAMAAAVGKALRERRIVRPLVWAYNCRMKHLLARMHAPLKVYHATEDYVSGDFFKMPPRFFEELGETLDHCDAMVAVSKGVAGAYREKMGFAGEMIVATNGCDFGFLTEARAQTFPPAEAPIACYQGGINGRVDLDLILDTVRRLRGWRFRFCGAVWFKPDEFQPKQCWEELLEEPNFTYVGELSAEPLRAEMHSATVGLIPFVRNPTIQDRSFPLKAFEYVACGLPVVGVPIRALEKWPELFASAQTADEFAVAIDRSRAKRYDPELLRLRAREASLQGYDHKFCGVVEKLLTVAPRVKPGPRRLLVLFDDKSIHVKTIEHHLLGFLNHSKSEVHYAPCTNDHECIYDLSAYDAVAIHYCVRVCVPGHLSPSYADALRAYPGVKILFAQDEYDHTDLTKEAVRDLGIQVFFTCVPPASIRTVYSEPFFDRVQFVPTLTGYVPPDFELDDRAVKPLAERKLLIAYRGRDIGYWYGDLAREKLMIGVRMKEICDARRLNTDIAWTHDKRIYGPAWLDFLAGARATLGTESGSNIFDFKGTLKSLVEEELRVHPKATYEEVHAKLLKQHEGKVVMNQISPKLFEAIILRTALILFEGEYSGVVKPDVHYIPLKKDFSDIDEVLRKLRDDGLVAEMTERAYRDVVASGRYSYQAFVESFDSELDAILGAPAVVRTPVHAKSLDGALLRRLEPEAVRPAPPAPKNSALRGAVVIAKQVFWPARGVLRPIYRSAKRMFAPMRRAG